MTRRERIIAIRISQEEEELIKDETVYRLKVSTTTKNWIIFMKQSDLVSFSNQISKFYPELTIRFPIHLTCTALQVYLQRLLALNIPEASRFLEKDAPVSELLRQKKVNTPGHRKRSLSHTFSLRPRKSSISIKVRPSTPTPSQIAKNKKKIPEPQPATIASLHIHRRLRSAGEVTNSSIAKVPDITTLEGLFRHIVMIVDELNRSKPPVGRPQPGKRIQNQTNLSKYQDLLRESPLSDDPVPIFELICNLLFQINPSEFKCRCSKNPSSCVNLGFRVIWKNQGINCLKKWLVTPNPQARVLIVKITFQIFHLREQLPDCSNAFTYQIKESFHDYSRLLWCSGLEFKKDMFDTLIALMTGKITDDNHADIDLYTSDVEYPVLLEVVFRCLHFSSFSFRGYALKQINFMLMKSPHNCELLLSLPSSWQELVFGLIPDDVKTTETEDARMIHNYVMHLSCCLHIYCCMEWSDAYFAIRGTLSTVGRFGGWSHTSVGLTRTILRTLFKKLTTSAHDFRLRFDSYAWINVIRLCGVALQFAFFGAVTSENEPIVETLTSISATQREFDWHTILEGPIRIHATNGKLSDIELITTLHNLLNSIGCSGTFDGSLYPANSKKDLEFADQGFKIASFIHEIVKVMDKGVYNNEKQLTIIIEKLSTLFRKKSSRIALAKLKALTTSVFGTGENVVTDVIRQGVLKRILINTKEKQDYYFCLTRHNLMYRVGKSLREDTDLECLPLRQLQIHKNIPVPILEENHVFAISGVCENFVIAASSYSIKQQWIDTLTARLEHLALQKKQEFLCDAKPISLQMEEPTLIPVDKVTECVGCTKSFSLLVRKHNCNKCGQVFCQSCCKYKWKLKTKQGKAKKEGQQVCLYCYAQLRRQTQTERNKEIDADEYEGDEDVDEQDALDII